MKTKKTKEPQYYRSVTGIAAYNYKVYYMKPLEKAAYFLIAFFTGAVVGYLFYGGIGSDIYGNPTKLTHILNALISISAGVVCGIAFIPIRTKQIIAKKQRMLNTQFRDFLESFNTSLGAGKNVPGSFQSSYEDLKIQYDEGSFILKELEIVLSGLNDNFAIEELLADFGDRSGNEDIGSFANVFKICYRKGGNIKETIRSTHSILNDKMEIGEDIETVVTSNKTEQNLMLVMPVALIGMIKMMSPDFAANFSTLTGILSTTVAIAMFAFAYYIGRQILDIKV